MIKAILFDMDGTLVNSERYYMDGTFAWLNKEGYKGKIEPIYKIIGTTMEQTYDILHCIFPLDKEYIKKRNTEYFTSHPINYLDYIFPNVIETIKELNNLKIRMVICSGSPKKDIEKFLKDTNLASCIEYYISSEECSKEKPNPEIYLKALNYLNIPSNEVLIVEDSPIGIEAGKNAGIKTIVNKDLQFNMDQSKADYIMSDFREIIKIVKGA